MRIFIPHHAFQVALSGSWSRWCLNDLSRPTLPLHRSLANPPPVSSTADEIEGLVFGVFWRSVPLFPAKCTFITAFSQLRNEGVVTAAAPVLNHNQDSLFTHSPCGESTIPDCFLLVCVSGCVLKRWNRLKLYG